MNRNMNSRAMRKKRESQTDMKYLKTQTRKNNTDCDQNEMKWNEKRKKNTNRLTDYVNKTNEPKQKCAASFLAGISPSGQ